MSIKGIMSDAMHVIVNSGGGPTLLSEVADGCFRDMSKMLNKVKLGGSAIDNDRAKCRRTPTFVFTSDVKKGKKRNQLVFTTIIEGLDRFASNVFVFGIVVV